MTNRPIIFSAPMVQALQREVAEQGTGKSMTRRLLAKQYVSMFRDSSGVVEVWTGFMGWRPVADEMADPTHKIAQRAIFRYGRPGDRLWVREAAMHNGGSVCYRADGDMTHIKWRPSIHMPRTWSRLTLTITHVKVERLRTISEIDCEQEGLVWVPSQKIWGVKVDGGYSPYGLEASECFMHLFCDLHGAAIWRDNPFVIALSFTVHEKNIDKMGKAP